LPDAPERRHGLLVDFGGVLTTNVFASFSAFCVAEGIEPEAIALAFRGDETARQLLVDLETGALEPAAFSTALGERLGIADTVDLPKRLFAGIRPDEAMIDAVRGFRARGVRTGLVSNSWGDQTAYDRDLLAELFDGVVISSEEGLRKPDPAIYELGAARIGLAPADCVFVDDLGGNLKPAAALGMGTVRHRTAAETIAQLEELLAVQ
jgi:epoxide hydrolase-like predicted phosphatase